MDPEVTHTSHKPLTLEKVLGIGRMARDRESGNRVGGDHASGDFDHAIGAYSRGTATLEAFSGRVHQYAGPARHFFASFLRVWRFLGGHARSKVRCFWNL